MSPGLFALTAIEIVWDLSVTIYPLVKGFRACPALDAFEQDRVLAAQ